MGGTGLPIVTCKQSTSSHPIPSRSKRRIFEVFTSTHDVDGDENDDNEVDENPHYSEDSKRKSSKFVMPISTLTGSVNNETNGTNGAKDSGMCEPMTALSVDCKDRYSALVTVHYYNVVETVVQPSDFVSMAKTTRTSTPLMTETITSTTTTTITTMAEVNVSISLLGKPFGSSTLGKTVSEYTRVPLFATSTTTDNDNQTQSGILRDDKKSKDGEINVDEEDWDVVDSELSEQSSASSNAAHSDIDSDATFTRQYHWPNVELDVVFSSDGNHLACLIPCPIPEENQTKKNNERQLNEVKKDGDTADGKKEQNQIKECKRIKPSFMRRKPHPISKVVIFTLRQRYRRSQLDKLYPSPPLPHYIQTTPASHHDHSNASQQQIHQNNASDTSTNASQFRQVDYLPPIILDAQILSLPNNDLLATVPIASLLLVTQITSICNVKVQRRKGGKKLDYCLLMGGCSDGSIVAVGYRRCKLVAVPYRPPQTTDTNWENNTLSIRHIVHHYGRCGVDDSSSRGRLVVIRADGKVFVYSTSFATEDSSSLLKHHSEDGKLALISPSLEEEDDNHDIDDDGNQLKQQQYHQHFKSKTDEGSVAVVNGKSNGSTVFLNDTTINNNNKNLPDPMPISSPQPWSLRSLGRIQIHVTPHSELPEYCSISTRSTVPPFVRAIFVDFSRVAFLTDPILNYLSKREKDDDDNGESIIAQVWQLADEHTDINSRRGSLSTKLLASLKMTPDKLDELRHGLFTSDISSTFSPQRHYDERITHMSDISIHCDRQTNCLALSSAFILKSNSKHDSSIAAGHDCDLLSIRTFVSIWNWRLSVSGLTIMGDSCTESKMEICDRGGVVELVRRHRQQEIVSHFYFCNNRYGGGDQFSLAHIRKIRGGCYLKKDLYSFGVLSPSEVALTGVSAPLYTFVQPNPILMMQDSISFPFLVTPKSCKDFTIQWKESKIPVTYTSLYGSIQTASIGRKYGRSIAIAASRGLCIFDLSSRTHEEENARKILSGLGPSLIPTPCIIGKRCDDSNDSGGVKNNTAKWRMFSELEERTLSVVAMTWWERSSRKSEVSEDLLVAVVKYHMDGEKLSTWNGTEEDDDEECTQCYLVCWSRRRLGRGSLQLLKEAPSSLFEDKIDSLRMGVPLKKGFRPASISLLSQPMQASHSEDDDDDDDDYDHDDRAILLLGSHQLSNRGNNYLAYQLQASNEVGEEVIVGESGENSAVLANLCSSGIIDDEFIMQFSSSLATSPFNIFVAGASFKFDLFKANSHCRLNRILDSNEHIATLGVTCATGKTMFSVTVTPDGPLKCACLYESDVSIEFPLTVQRYWISDTVVAKSTGQRYQLVWTVSKSDGCNFTWSVPFLQYQKFNEHPVASISTAKDMTLLRDDKNKKVKQIFLDVLLPHAETYSSHSQSFDVIERESIDFHGIVFHEGDILHGCVTDESEILLGPMPSIHCQFVFYVGQASRNIQHGQMASSKMQVYGLTDCIVGPPTFVASVLIDLSEDDGANHLHSTHTIQKFRYFNTTMVTLRAIVTCLTVLISTAIEKPNESEDSVAVAVGGSEGNSPRKMAGGLLSRVLTFLRRSLSDLHFASLCMSIGRQLEPHQCDHLFPLVFSSHASSKFSISDIRDNNNDSSLCITVEDLYYSAVDAGSLTVAASALPLFNTQKNTLKQCILLLHHSLSTILKLTSFDRKQCISCIREECVFFRQLYLYGLKLEDSAYASEVGEDSNSIEEVCTNVDLNPIEDDPFDDENSCDSFRCARSILKEPNNEWLSKQNSFVSPSPVLQLASTLLSPIKIFTIMKGENKNEIAISKAASSFIRSGYYDHIYKIECDPNSSTEIGETEKSAFFEKEQLDIVTDGYEDITEPTLGVAETIGYAIVSSMFYQPSHESLLCRLNKVAILCLLLHNDDSAQNSTHLGTDLFYLTESLTEDCFQKFLESISLLQEDIADAGYYSERDVFLSVKSFTSNLMNLFLDHLDSDVAYPIFETMMSLLTQHKSDKLSEITPILALVALSSGHACKALIVSDATEPSTLKKIYEQCVEEF